ncbi:sensor histidine kinase [Romboutsia lituseburensis]|uniref:sensor histidine kinase n=1 Tax=Romboutsia lituseburensis TaxID=1537 RepID=UPI00215A0E48|nr:sensor histidine kinase [Romboutsia lituseburensis]MCR8746248.1 GHKL domain-containing protein [Romboutsia lituseburensis]
MLGIHRALCIVNMFIFMFCFFMLMNKRGYICKCKLKKNIKSIVILLLIIWLALRGIPFGFVVLEVFINAALVLTLICKCIYEIDIKKSIINSLIYSLVYILIECSIYWFLFMTFTYIGNYIYVFNLGINFLIIFLGIYFLEKVQKIYNDNKYLVYVSLTIAVNIFIIVIINISTSQSHDLYRIVINNNIEYNNILYMSKISSFIEHVFPYILAIINTILIFIFVNSIKSEKEKAKLELVNEKLDMQYKYYLMVKESQEKMRQVYHDMNNHMNNIKSLKNSSEDVNAYINNIEYEVKNNKNIYNTGNALLDIILYEKSKCCMENNIDFNAGIDFSNCEFIDMIDISSIFSNLIDNAIEACNKIDEDNIDKYITIKSTFIKGYYVVRCENSKTNELIIKNNKIFTSKKDKFLHGIGLDSIKSSIKKYNGELKIKDSESKFIATIHIPVE